MGQPEIVCICGSMRFEAEMRMVAEHESLAGRMVLMPHVNTKRANGWWPEDMSVRDAERVKVGLDALHREKIRTATRVIVVTDSAGYIGESTRAEIVYAETLGKPVQYWSWQIEAPATMDAATARRELDQVLADLAGALGVDEATPLDELLRIARERSERDAGSLRGQIIGILHCAAADIAAGFPGCAADQVIELIHHWLDNPPAPDTYRWAFGLPALRFAGQPQLIGGASCTS